jgi:RNA recognition motif-containing protein
LCDSYFINFLILFKIMNIYVGNLSRKVTEEQLKQLFEAHGVVESVKIIKDKLTGMSRGFAFVVMPNDEEAQQALAQMNNQAIEGRNINVNEARPQEQRPARSFGGGGGSRGGFGGPRRPMGGGSRGPRGDNGGGWNR